MTSHDITNMVSNTDLEHRVTDQFPDKSISVHSYPPQSWSYKLEKKYRLTFVVLLVITGPALLKISSDKWL